jgi:hypothetical protein
VRGDSGAAAYLFRAAMTKPADVPLPAGETSESVNDGIDALYEDDAIGDIVYGLSGGTAENFERMAQDRSLMQSAVRLRLADGSASTVQQAVELTKRDMFGDVKTDISDSGKIILPTTEDPAPYRSGFNALLPRVGDALMASMTPAISAAATSDGTAQILAATRDNYVDQVLAEGYFTNSGDGFVFIDPKTGAYVPDEDGAPLIFGKEEVLSAGGQFVDMQNAVERAINPLNPAGYF